MYIIPGLIIITFLTVQFPGESDGTATLQIQMVSFFDEAHRGSLCNLTREGCDAFFNFCIDQYLAPYHHFYDMEQCSVFKGQTGVYANSSNVNFNHDMNGIHNPIVRQFSIWPGGVVLKADVWDGSDQYRNYLIEDGIEMIWNQRPAKTESSANYETRILKGTTEKSLIVRIRVWCDDYYYGPHCHVRCVPRDDVTGHYICHSNTGDKFCISGWESVADNCTIRANDCTNNDCKNSAICRDDHRSYTCICSPGFTGIDCETNIDECSSDPCLNNGTCIDGISGYTCSCSEHFVGNNCEKEACDQIDSFCKNGGTCYKERKCFCPVGYKGNFCEINQCDEMHCENGGICKEAKCICPEGFVGRLCDVDACSIKPCHNNGTCELGECNCTGTGYTGVSCHIKINYCDTLPCGRRGECVNELLSYHCLCYTSYNGTDCENQIQTTLFSEENMSTTVKMVIPDVLDEHKQEQDIDAVFKPKDMTMFYIIGGVVGGLIVVLIVLVIVILLYRRKRSNSTEEDPYYDQLRAQEHFQNPLYGDTDQSDINPVDTRVASTNTDPHNCTLQVPTEGAASLPVSPPSYNESQLATHGFEKGSHIESDNDDIDDILSNEKKKVPID